MCDRREEREEKRRRERRGGAKARGLSLSRQRLCYSRPHRRARNAHSVRNVPVRPAARAWTAAARSRGARRGPGGCVWHITVGHFRCIAWRLCPMVGFVFLLLSWVIGPRGERWGTVCARSRCSASWRAAWASPRGAQSARSPPCSASGGSSAPREPPTGDPTLPF